MNQYLKIGQLVQSKKGRDLDNYFLVVGWDDHNVFVADGYKRNIQQPKKKNIKHLWLYPIVADELKEKFANHSNVSNQELRRELAKLLTVKSTEADK